MKYSDIGLMITAACSVVYASIKYKANKAAKENCRKEAHDELYNREGSLIQMAEEEIQEYHNIGKSEEKAFERELQGWDKGTKYKGQVYSINEEAKKAIRMLEIDPDNAENKHLAEVKEKARNALAASKKALGYAQAEKERDRIVKEAKAKYEKKAAMLNNYAGDEALSANAANLRFAAEKERDEAIERANTAFNAKKEKFEAKQAEWEERILEAKTVREEMLAEGRKHILEMKTRKLDDLNAKRNNARESIRRMIVERRTDHENYILDRYEENKKLLADSGKAEDEAYTKKYAALTVTDKLASYFTGKNIGMGTVLAFGLTPVIGLGLIAWQYLQFLRGVTQKMKGA